MKIRQISIASVLIIIFMVSCSENGTVDSISSNSQIDNENGRLYKLPDGWKVGHDYVFDHYTATSEFGIWPSDNRQYAGSNGSQFYLNKLNELKSKWGFSHIAANIGNNSNITAIVNSGYPIQTNYMAMIDANTAGYDAVKNVYNGLPSSTYFWSYYTDEPLSEQNASILDVFTLDTLIQNQHPNSLFGFGETWLGAVYYYTNTYYSTHPDHVMCTKYFNDELEQDKDQRGRWTDFKNGLSTTFSKTWIAAHKDGSEFRDLLGYCRDNGIAPWFYQQLDAEDDNDLMISKYCEAAWLEGFLDKYAKKYEVTYKCTLTHTHDPNNPQFCNWVEYSRTLLGLVQL